MKRFVCNDYILNSKIQKMVSSIKDVMNEFESDDDISYEIDKLKETNRKLIDKVEELEKKVKSLEKHVQVLYGKISEKDGKSVAGALNNVWG